MKKLFFVSVLFFTIISLKIYAQDVPEPDVPLTNFVFPRTDIDEETEKQYLKAIDAQTKIELEQIKQYDKQKYSQLLMDTYFNSYSRPFFRMDKREKIIIERQQNMAKLEISAEALKLKYKHAKPDEKNKIKAELNKTLYALFDLKENDKRHQISMLQKELEKLEKSIKVRAQNRDEIVERRLQDLIGEGDYLEWE